MPAPAPIPATLTPPIASTTTPATTAPTPVPPTGDAANSAEPSADQQDEIFDVVDETNSPLTTAPRSQCHSEGLLHRSTHIFLFRTHLQVGESTPRLEVLLQQRSTRKKVGAGLWDVSVAEHLSAGETYQVASVRGMKEEIGVNVDEGDLVGIRECYLSKQRYEEAAVLDYMFTRTFAVLYDEGRMGGVQVDEVEVERVEWWQVGRVVRESERRPERFTRWFRIELEALDLVEVGKRITGEW